jgi:hypothetical protein
MEQVCPVLITQTGTTTEVELTDPVSGLCSGWKRLKLPILSTAGGSGSLLHEVTLPKTSKQDKGQ